MYPQRLHTLAEISACRAPLKKKASGFSHVSNVSRRCRSPGARSNTVTFDRIVVLPQCKHLGFILVLAGSFRVLVLRAQGYKIGRADDRHHLFNGGDAHEQLVDHHASGDDRRCCPIRNYILDRALYARCSTRVANMDPGMNARSAQTSFEASISNLLLSSSCFSAVQL